MAPERPDGMFYCDFCGLMCFEGEDTCGRCGGEINLPSPRDTLPDETLDEEE